MFININYEEHCNFPLSTENKHQLQKKLKSLLLIELKDLVFHIAHTGNS